MKKAFVFSIMTFLLLLSLLLISTSFISREKRLERQGLEVTQGGRMRYLEDDIISGLHKELLSIDNITLANTSSERLLNFTGGRLDIYLAHDTLIRTYESFIEQNYSTFTNTQIVLSNFSSGFTIRPYNSTYHINGTRATLLASNASQLKKIRLILVAEESVLTMTSNTSPPNSGSTQLQVDMIDSTGRTLLSATALLDQSASNTPFQANFSGGGSLKAQFGQLLGQSGTLLIESFRLNAQIRLVELTYLSLPEPITLTDGELSIFSPSAEINKTRPITLKGG